MHRGRHSHTETRNQTVNTYIYTHIYKYTYRCIDVTTPKNTPSSKTHKSMNICICVHRCHHSPKQAI